MEVLSHAHGVLVMANSQAVGDYRLFQKDVAASRSPSRFGHPTRLLYSHPGSAGDGANV